MLKQYKLRNYHFQLVIYIAILNIIGILIIGSAKHSVQKMQIVGLVLGLIVMTVISLMDYSVLLRIAPLYYFGIIGLLVGIGVPFFGKHVFFPIINACNDTASVRS